MRTRKILTALVFALVLLSPNFSLRAEEVVVVTLDTNPPVITLLGSPTVNLYVGDTYTDEGATAQDDVDGDITANIVKDGLVDTTTPGTYTINYNVSDASYNPAPLVTRTVIVSEPIVIEIPKETILIRSGNTIVYDGQIDLPKEGNVEIADSNGVPHQVNNRSVLGVLYALDQESDSFSFSNLQYYESFSSFYVKCIIPSGDSELCDNWQYVVGGVSPWTSIDTTMLSGGETIALYFGNPYRVDLSATTITKAETITTKAESYNYLDNTWVSRAGVTIGVTTTNPNDQWNPIVVSTFPVDVNGQAILSFADVGTYNIGIVEDYYFPSYSVTVNLVNSGGGGDGDTLKTLSMENAIAYLESNQNENGSFGEMLYTDWASLAISSASGVSVSTKTRLIEYLKNNPMNSSIATDNERHAMSLMALGINPYTGTGINYIQKIISAFDGKQFGDSSLVNDDIFALIVLKNAGYSSNDEEIYKSISFILSNQSSDGSWVGADMTAAGILALRNFTGVSGVPESISKAENYLINTQGTDGGFGNSFSTSWALQALSQNSSLSSHTANADAYLALKQQPDGGVDAITEVKQNRIWSTSYAVVGAMHKSWNSIMQSFSKESNTNDPTVSDAKVKKIEEIKVPEMEIKEVKIPEQEVLVEKIIKKKKIAKKEIVKNVDLIEEAVTPSSGSVAGASTSRSMAHNVLKSIWDIILTPFIWLLEYLGF